jgi:hypothetical protein
MKIFVLEIVKIAEKVEESLSDVPLYFEPSEQESNQEKSAKQKKNFTQAIKKLPLEQLKKEENNDDSIYQVYVKSKTGLIEQIEENKSEKDLK